MSTRRVSTGERRAALVRRHCLSGGAAGPREVVAALTALHASDPASVYLSVLARSETSAVADVSDALYGQRALVRWMAMRRTLFVFAREDIPVIQAAVSTQLGRRTCRSVGQHQHGHPHRDRRGPGPRSRSRRRTRRSPSPGPARRPHRHPAVRTPLERRLSQSQ
ncbi:MAG TPA: crosslink repair DNA glycosylase YcaQ family protein [Trebonia sp.]|nr:crosslink repair DNA glycosylase YcaQ family protein [Trebonia sp.]